MCNFSIQYKYSVYSVMKYEYISSYDTIYYTLVCNVRLCLNIFYYVVLYWASNLLQHVISFHMITLWHAILFLLFLFYHVMFTLDKHKSSLPAINHIILCCANIYTHIAYHHLKQHITRTIKKTHDTIKDLIENITSTHYPIIYAK